LEWLKEIIMRFFVCFVCFVVSGLFFAAHAQCPTCPGGVCPVGVRPIPSEPEFHGWYKGEDGKVTWYQHGVRCGTLDLVSGDWLTAGKTKPVNLFQAFGIQRPAQKNAKRSRVDCRDDCPCDGECDGDCPCCKFKDSSTVVEGTLNHGMLWKTDGAERCTVNGMRVTCPKLIETLAGKRGGAADIPDDSQLPRLVVLSKDPTIRRKILGDLAGLKDWQGKVIAQAYPPDDWAVSGLYPMPVDPTLYYVDADGLPRGCSKGYDAGPAGMAVALANAEKLRNPSGVDPSKAPDLAKPSSPTPPSAPNQPAPSIGVTPNQAGVAGLALVALGAGAAVWRKRRWPNA
jgi:hypothetical protein